MNQYQQPDGFKASDYESNPELKMSVDLTAYTCEEIVAMVTSSLKPFGLTPVAGSPYEGGITFSLPEPYSSSTITVEVFEMDET